MAARVLIAYASKKGSTAGIAEAVKKELVSAGYAVDVSGIGSVASLDGYDAVVIGVPVYAGRLLAEASDFIARNRDALSRVPVAGFVTGIAPVFPKTGDISVFTGQLISALAPVHPVAVTMFSGALDTQKLSFVERGLTSLLHVPTGDFRDWDAIAAWARELPSLLKV
jgi:menaquinone-dependent protoporphyrinogen oxidase